MGPIEEIISTCCLDNGWWKVMLEALNTSVISCRGGT